MPLSIRLICPEANIFSVGWQPASDSEVSNIILVQYKLPVMKLDTSSTERKKNSTEVPSNTNRLNQDDCVQKESGYSSSSGRNMIHLQISLAPTNENSERKKINKSNIMMILVA